MTPLSRDELPKLPDGWWWEDSTVDGPPWIARSEIDELRVECYATDSGLHVDSYECASCPLSVVAAVLVANGVTLPDVPGYSTILGGK